MKPRRKITKEPAEPPKKMHPRKEKPKESTLCHKEDMQTNIGIPKKTEKRKKKTLRKH